MSGHSKWKTIKRAKAKTDSARGKIFTKIVREIASAAKQGGGDPAGNPRLRLAIDNAKEANMPSDNIDRAIAKATGAGAVQLEEVTYEGYGPGGVAVIVECLTDNKQRTVAEIRNSFTRNGGNMGASGCVNWIFKDDRENPTYTVKVEGEQARQVIKLLEALEDNDDVQNVYSNFDVPEEILEGAS